MKKLYHIMSMTALLVLVPSLAAAHSTEGLSGGFISGILHPILGPDHLVAMVAVGLWGAQLGRPLIYALPLAFPIMMAVGGMLGMNGLAVPGLEIGIALSAVVLGLVVVFGWRAPVPVAVAIVGAFAVFHGMAHGLELPDAAQPMAYGAGFLISTGLLHCAGIAIGMLNQAGAFGPQIVRAAGGAVAVVGAVFLVPALGLT